MKHPSSNPEWGRWSLAAAAAAHVADVLQAVRGNKMRAARLLGITRTTLYTYIGGQKRAAS